MTQTTTNLTDAAAPFTFAPIKRSGFFGNLEALKADFQAAGLAGATELISTIAVRKPKAMEFIRTNPDEAMTMTFLDRWPNAPLTNSSLSASRPTTVLTVELAGIFSEAICGPLSCCPAFSTNPRIEVKPLDARSEVLLLPDKRSVPPRRGNEDAQCLCR